MDQTTSSRSDARAIFEKHAPDSSLFHVGRVLLGMHAEIADHGRLRLGNGPTTPDDRPVISFAVETIDDVDADPDGAVDRLLALAPVSSLPMEERRAPVDAEALAKQLTQALGVYVNEVHLISLADPYADVGWLTTEALAADETDFSETLDACLDHDVDGAYWARLDAAIKPKLLRALGEEGIERIETDVASRFSDGIGAAIRIALRWKVSDARFEAMRASVLDTLALFIGAAAIEDRSAGVPLGHLVRTLTAALPLGMKKGEPGTWLFLVA